MSKGQHNQLNQPNRTAEVIQKEVPKAKLPIGLNAQMVEMELAKARNNVAALNNRLESLNREQDEVRKELEVANKIKSTLDGMKGNAMEYDKLRGVYDAT